MAISNSTPITTSGTFDSWWIRSLMSFSINTFQIMFAPCNGQYVLVSETVPFTLDVANTTANDSTFAGIMGSFASEAQRQYSIQNGNPSFTNFSIQAFEVCSISPSSTTHANFTFLIDGNLVNFNILDIFGLAAVDATFASVMGAFINEIGRQGKLAGVIT